ncbi:hypothetical protein [Streptomyces sp. KLOTTS4A1]|uniref:hypothetical protein n=1 Tax=Streptomyces sp. KLOTTS4A1 TaxID=3390996 RepID=UPI0039F4A058
MADVGAGRILAAFASLGAAAIHFAAAPDHYAEWWAAGVFFYAVGAFQAGWTLAVLRASGTAVMLLGLVANAAVIATWAVSRTLGMPVGPGAGVPEEVTRVGVTVVFFQAVVCLVALARLRRRPARGFASSFRAVVLVGAAGAMVTGLTMPAVEGALSHSHSEADGPTSHSHDEDDTHGGEETPPSGTGSGTGSQDGTKADAEETTAPSAEESPTTQPAEEPADGHGHDDEPHGH